MPIFDRAMPQSEMKRRQETHRCAECGGNLSIAWGGHLFDYEGYVLRCSVVADHVGIERVPKEDSMVDSTALKAMPKDT
jgi:hypothetical protein